jgi:hypothetical protein
LIALVRTPFGAADVLRSEERLKTDNLKTGRIKPGESVFRFSGFLLSKIV